jgi:hypothetical protein
MIEVLKQLVDALQTYGDKHRKTYLLEGAWDEEITKGDAAIKAGKQAIAELESQEPFCYVYKENGEDFFAPKDGYYPADAKPLYTHPPQRTWVGLTDDEHCDIWYKESLDWMEYGKAIEAKLKQKNGFAEEKNT